MRPLSILHGKDTDVIPLLLGIHSKPNPTILDCTYNKGTMWKGSPLKPLRMDINPEHDLDVVADFKNMPFQDKSFDVIVFDPPHLPTNAASPNSSKIWEKRYGITSEDKDRSGDNVSGLFTPFLKEAKRVLVPNGIVLAKIADLTHNHRYQWQMVDFINATRDTGMTPCDLLIKNDPAAGNLKSSKWKNTKHLRKCHVYWIVVRNSKKCEL